jgi:hypothetical protein
MIRSADVLVIEAVTPAQYPSVNQSVSGSHRAGKKSPGYHDLFNQVVTQGKAAVDAGWQMIVHPCRLTVIRYCPDGRVFDALNLAQTEANALTRAGVWADDTLAQSVHLRFHPHSEGPDRVVIIVERLPAPAGIKPRAPRPRKSKAADVATASTKPVTASHDRYALLNGEPIPMEEALRLVNKT